MNNAMTIQVALEKAANADMALCRKQGRISIAQTKLGTINVNYDKATRSWTLSTANEILMVAATGKLAKDFLLTVYDVVQS